MNRRIINQIAKPIKAIFMKIKQNKKLKITKRSKLKKIKIYSQLLKTINKFRRNKNLFKLILWRLKRRKIIKEKKKPRPTTNLKFKRHKM
jgi:hypothetical protein